MLQGPVGRVFASSIPEMSHDVQQYDKGVYPRLIEAQRCKVHSTLIMPVFASAERLAPFAVFEMVQADKDVMFPAIVDCLITCLKV